MKRRWSMSISQIGAIIVCVIFRTVPFLRDNFETLVTFILFALLFSEGSKE